MDILLVEDERSILALFAEALQSHGHDVVTATDGLSGLALLESRTFDVIISDVRLPKVNGIDLFHRARQVSPETQVIIMTAYATVKDAVTVLKEGGAAYLTKPIDLHELLDTIDRISKERELVRRFSSARAEPQDAERIVARSPAMVRTLDLVGRFAPGDDPVLISGESGTGKELVARELHRSGPRADQPFISVNCAAFPDTLLEAELFGHERGAAGAQKRRDGRFKAAGTGIVFLDNVSEMSAVMQAKLLRVLQQGSYEPIGTSLAEKVTCRLVSATDKNLKDLIAQGKFREDLYFRLKVFELPVPPLRERGGDLLLLLEHFLRQAAGGVAPDVSARALAALAQYPFPGNVRELEHAIRYSVVLAAGAELDLPHLPPEIAGPDVPPRAAPPRSLSEAVREFEREFLRRALARQTGGRAHMAETLGISRKNLWEKLRGYGLASDRSTKN